MLFSLLDSHAQQERHIWSQAQVTSSQRLALTPTPCLGTHRNIDVIPTFSLAYFMELGVSESYMGVLIEEVMDNFLRYFMEGDDIERPWADDYCVNRDGRLHPAVKAVDVVTRVVL